MPADALPSLFRWAPTMVTLDGGIVLGVLGDRLVTHRRATIGGRIIAWEDPCQARPDMTHAGTRGLVLEQVRAATEKPFACPRFSPGPGDGSFVCAIVDTLGYLALGNGAGATPEAAEGNALLDALHRAEARRG